MFAVRMRMIEVRMRLRIGVSPCALNFRVPRAFNFVEEQLLCMSSYTVTVVRELLSSANANNSENSGVRCANANNRGANTNTNWGFPLYHNYGFPF